MSRVYLTGEEDIFIFFLVKGFSGETWFYKLKTTVPVANFVDICLGLLETNKIPSIELILFLENRSLLKDWKNFSSEDWDDIFYHDDLLKDIFEIFLQNPSVLPQSSLELLLTEECFHFSSISNSKSIRIENARVRTLYNFVNL